MNISGRIISNQGISKQENERVVLTSSPDHKARATGIKTPEGLQQVLNLRKASGRSTLKQALREVDPTRGKDIYLRVARTQVLKLHLSEPTTRSQLLRKISEVLQQPQSDYDIKFKAGLARVYHTLTHKSSEGSRLHYLKQAPLEKLDEKMQALKQEFRQRMPENPSSTLRHLLRDYQGPSETLESISSRVFDQRQGISAEISEFIASVNQAKQNNLADLLDKVGKRDILTQKLYDKLKTPTGEADLRTQLTQTLEQRHTEGKTAFIATTVEQIQAHPERFFRIHPGGLEKIHSDAQGMVTKTATGIYDDELKKIPDSVKQMPLNELIANAFKAGVLTQQDFSPTFDSWLENKAIAKVSASKIYSQHYNKATQTHPLSGTYHGQTDAKGSQQEFVRGLVQIAQNRRSQGKSNFQNFPGRIQAVDPEKDLDDVGHDFFRFERAGDPDSQPVKQRVYINVKGDFGPAVMKQIVDLIDAQGHDQAGIQMAKISGPKSAGQRLDTIVVYTSGPEHSQKVIDRLREIQSQGVPGNLHLPRIPAKGDLFGDQTPGMTEQVMPGVSLGDEPDEATYHGQESFGGLRSQVMAQVAFQTRDRDLPFTEFHALVESALRKALINPDRVNRNLDEPLQTM